MRTLIALAILAILAIVAVPAVAGDGNCGSCPLGGACPAGSCDVDGFDCQNSCPLAKQANASRSLGRESTAVSTIARMDLAHTVAANLQKI